MKTILSLLAVVGISVALTQQANAVPLTLNGIIYNVTTFSTSYLADAPFLESQPWWGDFDLATQAAGQVGASLPNAKYAFLIFNSTIVQTREYDLVNNVVIGTATPYADVVPYAVATVIGPVPTPEAGSSLLLLSLASAVMWGLRRWRVG